MLDKIDHARVLVSHDTFIRDKVRDNLFKKDRDDHNLASIMASDEIESIVSHFSENHVSAKHFLILMVILNNLYNLD